MGNTLTWKIFGARGMSPVLGGHLLPLFDLSQ